MMKVSTIILAALQHVSSISFDISGQAPCVKECIDNDYLFFSTAYGSSGTCCSPDEPLASCLRGGFNSIGKDVTKYFSCPTGYNCNQVKMGAQQKTQKYVLDTNQLREDELICNHEVQFSVDAGHNDVM